VERYIVFKISGSIKERTPNEHQNGHRLTTRWALEQRVALGSDQSFVSRLRQGDV